jgi:hypothetical protein
MKVREISFKIVSIQLCASMGLWTIQIHDEGWNREHPFKLIVTFSGEPRHDSEFIT